MTTPDKPDPARVWMFAEKLLAEEEAERIEKLSDDDLRAELRKDGVDPARIPSGRDLIDGAIARAAKRRAPIAPALPAPPARRRSRSAVWLLAAALVLAVGTVVAFVRAPEIVAHRVSPREAAEKLREEAIGECARASWGACKEKLDEAARLDPDGESAARVQNARGEIEKAGR